MLWVNLVMDSFASLALATEPPVDELLNRPPVGKNLPIITKQMFFNMFGQAFYQLIVTIIILFWGTFLFYSEGVDRPAQDIPTSKVLLEKQKSLFVGSTDKQLTLGWFSGCGATQHYTYLFNCFVIMTLFNQFAARKLRAEYNLFEGASKNKYFVFLAAFEFCMQIAFTYFGDSFGSYNYGLTGYQWLWCVIFGAIGWIWQLGLNAVSQKYGIYKDDGRKKGGKPTTKKVVPK